MRKNRGRRQKTWISVLILPFINSVFLLDVSLYHGGITLQSYFEHKVKQ